MNEILKEVREAKQRVNAHFDHDVHKYCVDVIRRQEETQEAGCKIFAP